MSLKHYWFKQKTTHWYIDESYVQHVGARTPISVYKPPLAACYLVQQFTVIKGQAKLVLHRGDVVRTVDLTCPECNDLHRRAALVNPRVDAAGAKA